MRRFCVEQRCSQPVSMDILLDFAGCGFTYLHAHWSVNIHSFCYLHNSWIDVPASTHTCRRAEAPSTCPHKRQSMYSSYPIKSTYTCVTERATLFSCRLTKEKYASLAWFDFSIFNLNSVIWKHCIWMALHLALCPRFIQPNLFSINMHCAFMIFRIEIEIIIKFQSIPKKQIKQWARAQKRASCFACTMWHVWCHVSCTGCAINSFGFCRFEQRFFSVAANQQSRMCLKSKSSVRSNDKQPS